MSRRESGVQVSLERVKTWMIVFSIVLMILGYGLIMYLLIGDKGPPGWQYGSGRDVPGEDAERVETLQQILRRSA